MDKNAYSLALGLGAIVFGGMILLAGREIGELIALVGLEYLLYLRFRKRPFISLLVLGAINAVLCVEICISETGNYIGVGLLSVVLLMLGLFSWYKARKSDDNTVNER